MPGPKFTASSYVTSGQLFSKGLVSLLASSRLTFGGDYRRRHTTKGIDCAMLLLIAIQTGRKERADAFSHFLLGFILFPWRTDLLHSVVHNLAFYFVQPVAGDDLLLREEENILS